MKNIHKFLIIFLFSLLFISGCDKQRAVLLLNDSPINKSNYQTTGEKPTFRVRQKIYFLLAAKEPIKTNVVRLQILKIDNKYGYNISQIEIALALDIEIGENQQVISNSFSLHNEGNYFVRIFAMNNLYKPLAEADFTIEN